MLVLKSGGGKISVTYDQFNSAGVFGGYKSNVGLNTWKLLVITPNTGLDLCVGL